MNNKEIGKYLQQKRKENEKTQKDIADELGVTYQAVSRWETGESIPDIETLCMIADMYKVSVDEILQRKQIIVKNEVEEEDMMWPLCLAGVAIYTIAFILFLVINSLWIAEVALAAFLIIIVAGLLPTNIYYFTRSSEAKELNKNRDKYIYIGTYTILFVYILIVVFTYFF